MNIESVALSLRGAPVMCMPQTERFGNARLSIFSPTNVSRASRAAYSTQEHAVPGVFSQ
jgi:hypothetical protein